MFKGLTMKKTTLLLSAFAFSGFAFTQTDTNTPPIAILDNQLPAYQISEPKFLSTEFDQYDRAGADWGRHVAINDRGDYVVAGPGFDGNKGIVTVYIKNDAGGHDIVNLQPDGSFNYYDFGYSVAINNEGVVAVGIPRASIGKSITGAVAVYTPDGVGGFTEQILSPSDAIGGEYLGMHVKILEDGTIFASGIDRDATESYAGALHRFTPNGSGGYDELKIVPEIPIQGGRFAKTFDLMPNGTIVASMDAEDSRLYLFTPNSTGGYTETQVIYADQNIGVNFGATIVANNEHIFTVDGQYVLVFAKNADGIFEAVQKLDFKEYAQSFTESIPTSLALSNNDTLLIGVYGYDNRHVPQMTNFGGVFEVAFDEFYNYQMNVLFDAPTEFGAEGFGSSVAVNASGEVLIGAYTYSDGDIRPGALFTASPSETTSVSQVRIAVDENFQGPIQITSFSDAEDDLTYSLGSTIYDDEKYFHIDANGNLSFIKPPNYEDPYDQTPLNQYFIKVIGSDGEYSTAVNYQIDIVDYPHYTVTVPTLNGWEIASVGADIDFDGIIDADEEYSLLDSGAYQLTDDKYLQVCIDYAPMLVTYSDGVSTKSVTYQPHIASTPRGGNTTYVENLATVFWPSAQEGLGVANCADMQAKAEQYQAFFDVANPESGLAGLIQRLGVSYNRNLDTLYADAAGENGDEAKAAADIILQGLKASVRDTLALQLQYPEHNVWVEYIYGDLEEIQDWDIPNEDWLRLEMVSHPENTDAFANIWHVDADMVTVNRALYSWQADFVKAFFDEADPANNYSIMMGAEFKADLSGELGTCSTFEIVNSITANQMNVQWTNYVDVDEVADASACSDADLAMPSRHVLGVVGFTENAEFEYQSPVAAMANFNNASVGEVSFDIGDLVAFAAHAPYQYCESGMFGADSITRQMDTDEGSYTRADDWAYALESWTVDGVRQVMLYTADENPDFNGCDFSLVDSDRDGVNDAEDWAKTDASEWLDSDEDGTGDNMDAFPLNAEETLDTDSDGMGDNFEFANGLDLNDPNDAAADKDQDGASNLAEFQAGSDLNNDDQVPVFASESLEDIVAYAISEVFDVELPDIVALDAKDGELIAEHDLPADLSTGEYTITWRVMDLAGNTAEITQSLIIHPVAYVEKSMRVAESGEAEVVVYLTGEANSYPVLIPLALAGTASEGDDYLLLADEVSIAEGKLGMVTLTLLDDSVAEGDESIEVTLGQPNAGVGLSEHQLLTVTIYEQAVAPIVTLSAWQGGKEVIVIDQAAGLVSLQVDIDDINGVHEVDWSTLDNAITTQATEQANVVTFDPANLSAMVYPLRVAVSDSEFPGKMFSSQLLPVRLTPNAPPADKDMDGIPDDFDSDDLPANFLQPLLADTPAATKNKLLLAFEPGTHSRLGKHAMQNEQGARLGEDFFVQEGMEDDEFTFPAGLYDFSVNGLADVGMSTQIVIPQSVAIPAKAVYRKMSENGWQDFVVDEKNHLASAAMSNGLCPMIGAAEYQIGLHEGDSCVQLTIEDGGPNDADGVANGAVDDPGGIATLSQIELSGALHDWMGAMLQGVDVSLSGSDQQLLGQTTSIEDGTFSLVSSQREGEVALTFSGVAVEDGSKPVTSADALAALKISVGLNPNSDGDLTPYQLIAADINGDGRVTSADALQILKVSVGLDRDSATWVFANDDMEMSDVDRTNVPQLSEDVTLDVSTANGKGFVGILKGNVNGL